MAEICQAFEDLVEFEEEGVRCKVIHLSTAPTALFDVFPAIENSGLYLIVDHAGDVGVLLLEDVPEDLDEGLGAAAAWSKNGHFWPKVTKKMALRVAKSKF